MSKPIRHYGGACAQKKVVNLERWRWTGRSDPDIAGSPASELAHDSFAAGAYSWRQAVTGMSREEKQTVLLMFILSPDASDDQLSALLEAIAVMG